MIIYHPKRNYIRAFGYGSPADDPTETEAQAQGKATEAEDRCHPGSGSVNGGFSEL